MIYRGEEYSQGYTRDWENVYLGSGSLSVLIFIPLIIRAPRHLTRGDANEQRQEVNF